MLKRLSVFIDQSIHTLNGWRFVDLKQYFAGSTLRNFQINHSIENLLRQEPPPAPSIAVISSLPPDETGIANCSFKTFGACPYSVDLFSQFETIDSYIYNFYHAHSVNQHLKIYFHQVLPMARSRRNYLAQVFVLGNSNHNLFVMQSLSSLRQLPSLVPTYVYIHDPCLLNLLKHHSNLNYSDFRSEIEFHYGHRVSMSHTQEIHDGDFRSLLPKRIFGVKALLSKISLAGIIVNSQAAADMIREDFRDADCPPIHVLFHPVFDPVVPRKDARGKNPRIGSFGIPSSGKLTEVIVSAWKILRKQNPDFELVLAGYDTKDYVNRHKLRDEPNLFWEDSPSTERLEALMQTCHVAVQLRKEALGESSGILPQLLAQHIPTVVSAHGAFKEYGDAVTLAPPQVTPEELAKLILHLKDSGDHAAAMDAYLSERSPRKFCEALLTVVGGIPEAVPEEKVEVPQEEPKPEVPKEEPPVEEPPVETASHDDESLLNTGFMELWKQHNDHRYRIPVDLRTTQESLDGPCLILGSCFAEGFQHAIKQHVPHEIDYLLYHNAGELPEQPPRPLSEYRFQMIILALRYAMPEMPFGRNSPDDEEAFRELFRASEIRLHQWLEGALQYHRQTNLLTYVCNYILPQQNPLGRLQNRYTLSNPVHFAERLNESLARYLAQFKNVYVIDTDSIASTFGKKYISDESVWLTNHGTWINDWDVQYDHKRLAVLPKVTDHYMPRVREFHEALWHEVVSNYCTTQQKNLVKMVVVDLDDTLWRGVLAEDDLGVVPIEGWPIALVEALLYLKKRGVLLGIVSKNDESKITAAWDDIFKGLISLNDFAVRKINWKPKSVNMEELLKEVNLLPKNVIFIDDNPVERAAVQSCFPDMRILGEYPYYLKRILLWSAESQVPVITNESARRTEMVQAQVEREQVRATVSREEFLAMLKVKYNFFEVEPKSSQFARTLELLNKTNQFNTTGIRWKVEDLSGERAGSRKLYAFDAEDIYTKYGLIGVVIINGCEIEQMVMSCRVVGLELEFKIMKEIEALAKKQRFAEITGKFIGTPANILCRTLFRDCGFVEADGTWKKSLA